MYQLLPLFRHLCLFVLTSIGCLFLSKSSFAQGEESVILTINSNNQFQTIDHFGASDAWSIQFVGLWPDGKKNAIADLLFSTKSESGKPKGIGLSMWRFNLGAGSAEQGKESGIKDEWRRAESFLNSEGKLDMSKAKGQVWFAQAAKDRGVDKLLLFSNSPLVQFTKNGKAFSSDGKSNLDRDKAKDFADYISSVGIGLQNIGLHPKYISPVNEPQWDWSDGGQEGNPYTNDEIASFIKILDQSLSEQGFEAKIDVAEAGKINYLFELADKPDRGEQVKAFFDPSSENYLGNLSHVSQVISAHSYFTTSPSTVSEKLRSQVLSELEAIPGLNYWMTEYCILGGNEGEINGNGRDLGMESALYLARVIHQDLTISNASAWNWWLAVSPYNYKDGLVYIDKDKSDGAFYESKMLWTLGNYSRFVRPGFVRVEASINSGKLMVSAYLDPGGKQKVVVLVNPEPKAIQVSLNGDSSKITSIQSYLTNEQSNLSPLLVSTDFQVPAKSIMTLVLD
ncbi:glycoside hydrolase family 30 protein [Algoriphagus lutimaris]|uniref:glycoside hydrolase n=1 Tax=Algoriphagus lutimaris TaxID=613197 RepID=UPI00196AFC41|nr:glycoside hydrolase [Algoriphagus lutimaris]MBN3521785.1 glycoside hydrolase family 30 protein [Algoriphagus lutimaris]